MFIDVRKQKKQILKVKKFENLIVRVLTRTLGNKILDCCQSGVLSDIITHRGLNILYKLDKKIDLDLKVDNLPLLVCR